MSEQPLRQLLEIGDSMKSALEDGRIDTYFDLLGKRGTLLDALSSYRHPSEIDADWREVASALSVQQGELMDAANSQRCRLQDAIERIEQVKAARRSYHQQPGRSSILNENLRV